MTDDQKRKTALTSLALKTQAHRWDDAVMAAYLTDPELAAVALPDFLAACHALSRAEWFPKLGELLAECYAQCTVRLEADRARVLALNSGYADQTYRCAECEDTSWVLPRWCDGTGHREQTGPTRSGMPQRWCGLSRPHRAHSWTERCEHWLQATQAARDAFAARGDNRPQAAPKSPRRAAWAS